MKTCHRVSVMPLLFLSTRTRETKHTVATTTRGTSLLSLTGKITVRIILNQLVTYGSEANLQEAQHGLSSSAQHNRHNICHQASAGKVHRPRQGFVPWVHRPSQSLPHRAALWTSLSKLGRPRKLVHTIQLYHDHRTREVLPEGATSAPKFGISNGLIRECVLAPVLFHLFFACVLN